VSLSKEKSLGNLSPDQLSRTLAMLEGMDGWGDLYQLLRQKPRFRRLIESRRVKFSWSLAYEFDYVIMVGALVWIVGEQAAVDRILGAEDRHEEVLKMAEEDPVEPIARAKAAKVLWATALLMALIKSTECLTLYSVTINELVSRAGEGDAEALFKAVRVDPSVLTCPSIGSQLSLAVMRRDRKFLRRLKAALDGPHKGRKPYRKLRFTGLVLEESGALALGNRDHIFDVVANQLRLYEQQRGDPFKGLFTQFNRWKAESTT
jgi:hypothetical protein